jgi:hypothetical protein
MAQLKDHEKDMIRIARGMIRDMIMGYSPKELGDDPARVCQGLSVIIGDTYDFESGETTCVTTNDSGDEHFPEDDK